MKEFCVWCDQPVLVPDQFNRKLDVAVCGRQCRTLEGVFRMCFSNEEYNRRMHYAILTRGSDE